MMRDLKLKSEITYLANQMIESDKININDIIIMYGVVNIVNAFGDADEFMQLFKGYLSRTTHWRYKKRIENRYKKQLK